MTSRVQPMALDSGTSSEAAHLQTREVRERSAAIIVSLIAEHGPLTDDALVEHYRARAHAYTSVPLITPQAIRTRRSELVHAGQVRVAHTDARSDLGNRATAWTLA